MRKTLLSLTLAAMATAATAQTISSIPYDIEPYMLGITVSPNAKYVGGCDATGIMLLADWASQSVLKQDPTTDTGTGCIRSVNDDGLGVGFNDDLAVSLDSKGNYKVIYDEEGGGIAEDLTPDGGTICGEVDVNTAPVPCLWRNGERVDLPVGTNRWLGIKSLGAAATFISSDATVVAGHIADKLSTRPLVLWIQNKDGKTYSFVPVYKKYCKRKTEDGEGLMCYFTPTGMSDNGKWIALTVSTDEGRLTMGRYNVETETFEQIHCQDAIDADMICEASGIADDGTILGYYGDTEMGLRYGVICKPGETEAVSISSAFPEIADLAHYQELGFNVPAAITPDAKHIVGYAADLIEYEGEQAQIFVTYMIDVDGKVSSVKSVSGPFRLDASKKKLFDTVAARHVSKASFLGLMMKDSKFGIIKK